MGDTKIIVCAAVVPEIPPYLLDGIETQIVDSGLHSEPDRLRDHLQHAIDETPPSVETVLLGYGLCAQAVIGLKARNHTLVLPLVDDCIALFLGSCAAYRACARSCPGTYFLTKGWVDEGITTFDEYDEWIERYGAEKAERIYRFVMGSYRRLALINTGRYELDGLRDYARETATRFSLDYGEIPGDTSMLARLIDGKWGDEFLLVPPGQEVKYGDFLPMLLGEPLFSQSLTLARTGQ